MKCLIIDKYALDMYNIGHMFYHREAGTPRSTTESRAAALKKIEDEAATTTDPKKLEKLRLRKLNLLGLSGIDLSTVGPANTVIHYLSEED